jgi:hypothetical protein
MRHLCAPLLALVLALVLAPALASCIGEGDAPGLLDGSLGRELSFPDYGSNDYRVVYACDTVDILFVIDNSSSMEAEQKNLVANFPKFIEQIEAIDPPIESYRLGVVSTDIGAGPYEGTMMGNCKPDGDDGKLQHAPKGINCASSYPKWLEGPSAQTAQDFGCIAELGLEGCGYEQPMEAALRGLTAQTYNDGFLRRNAPLAIIFITDEDDCSAKDTTLFDPDDASLSAYPLRCVKHPGKLHPVSRYIQGLSALKDDPERLVVAAITGPPGTVEVDPAKNLVVPACSTQEFGSALPGNRFFSLTRAFGERGVQESLCKGDLAQPLEVIGKAIERVCLQ